MKSEQRAKAKRPSRRRRVGRVLKRSAIVSVSLAVLCAVTFAILWIAYPFPLERLGPLPASPVVTDRRGGAMLELVASDQQWRRPVTLEQMSPWLIKATIAVEDKRFYEHCGVDKYAVARAAWQDVCGGRVVSGASTITMQVCRMMDGRPRNWRAKLVESFRALQLERLRDKRQILEVYLNTAPYGGNYRGVEAAAMGYFGKHASDLSLGEAALLAGLPQSPARYRPDRNGDKARARRRVVLERMAELGMIDASQLQQAMSEPLAVASRLSEKLAWHGAWMALSQRPAGGRTTIDGDIQRAVLRCVRPAGGGSAQANLPAGADLGIVVLDISRGDIVAMVGSARVGPDAGVNNAIAWRSPGSALKPFIYAAAFEARMLAPDSTVYDVPIHRGGWSPANFDRKFRGPLPAGEALRESLNVPAILVAQGVGLGRCIGVMQGCGVRFPMDAQSRGGLALSVGAVEVRLLDLTNAYATIGRGGVARPARLFADESNASAPVLDAGVCAAVSDILSSRRRRPAGMEGLSDRQVPWFMWKTGTSAARRDAWAVGHNGKYAIGVWAGHRSGVGDVNLVGSQAAEPLLARLFALPALRSDRDPSPPQTWTVTAKLPPPPEAGGPLQITSPTNNATFVAVNGSAVLHPSCNSDQSLLWFLNGQLLPPAQSSRLTLSPGKYELRCVGDDGSASAVQISVR